MKNKMVAPVFTPIPSTRPISKLNHKAVMHILRHKFAFYETYRRHLRDKIFECIVNVGGDTHLITSDFAHPYGLMKVLTDKVMSVDIDVKYPGTEKKEDGKYYLRKFTFAGNEYEYTTFCNVAAAASLYFYLGFNKANKKLPYKGINDSPFSGNDQHPIYKTLQHGATKLCKYIKTDSLGVDRFGFYFVELNDSEVNEAAKKGYLVYALWQNDNGASHVATVMHVVDGVPYVFNAGTWFGYMTVNRAFYGDDNPKKLNKVIKYYALASML